MSIIYCSQCGAKSSAGSKFCSSCGNALSSFAPQKKVIQEVNPQIELEDSSFRRPSRLAYEIQDGGNNKFSAKELFNASPVGNSDRLDRPVDQVQDLTREEYLAQSLKECAPRVIKDIDES